MSSSVSAIGVNSQGIGNAYGFGLRPRANEKAPEKEVVQQQAPQQPQVSAGEVLGYMAQAATMNSPVAQTRTITPANYVDSASAARIGESMKDFENNVGKNLENVLSEFPTLSESAAYAVAANMTEKAIA